MQTIKLAAVKHTKTGRVFSDTCHAFAFLNADEGLGYVAEGDLFIQGFILNTGAFVDRFEAFEIAESARQITEYDVSETGFVYGELVSEQIA